MERSENGIGEGHRRSRIAGGGKGEWFYRKEKSAFASLRKTADRWYRTAEKICPEKMIGDSEILERKLAIKYSGRRLAEAVRFHRQRNVFLYTAVLAAALTVAAVLCLLSVRATDDIGRIHRPGKQSGTADDSDDR